MSEEETETRTQTSFPKPGSRRKQRVRVDEEPVIASPDAALAVAERPRGRRNRDEALQFKARTVDPRSVRPSVAPATKQFWVGVASNAPFDCKHIAGVTFQKWSGIIEADPKTGALILDRARPGHVIDMDEVQERKVLERAAAKVIRVTGNRADATGNYRCDSFDVTVPGYHATPKDEPIGKYIYMIEIDDVMPRGWRDERPPMMYTEE